MDTDPPAKNNAQPAYTIVIPMAVQALVINRQLQNSDSQFAPLIQPDYAALRQGPVAGAPTHDLMDSIDFSCWRMQARYSSRFVDLATRQLREGRTGVYLSWCLPRVYRAAFTATKSAKQESSDVEDGPGGQEWEARKARAGFKISPPPPRPSSSSSSSNDEGETQPSMAEKYGVQFRPAPDRWIIVRQVRGKPDLSKRILVESNCLRPMDEMDPLVDIDLETSPAMDANQPMMRMGRVVPLTADEVIGGKKRRYREPFNASELGHEYFADYSPHNMGVFSCFDDVKGIEDDVIDYLIVGFHSSPEATDPLTFMDAEMVKLFGPRTENNDGTSTSIPFTNEDLLKSLQLQVDNTTPISSTFLQAEASPVGRTLTQGIIRNVRWNRTDADIPAHNPAAWLQDQIYAEQPIALGTHILDALAAYMHLFLDPKAAANSKVLLSYNQILTRVNAKEDNVDSLRLGLEEAASQSFLSQSEGTRWALPKDEKEDVHKEINTAAASKGSSTMVTSGRDKTKPSRADKIAQDANIQRLAFLNEGQKILDTCSREAIHLLQRLFQCWWNAASLKDPSWTKDRETLAPKIREQVAKITARMKVLTKFRADTQREVNRLHRELTSQLGGGQELVATPDACFGRNQDPTILVAGARSGWPDKFNDVLPVRVAADILPSNRDKTWLDDVIPLISRPANKLLRELEAPSYEGKINPYVALEDMKETQGWFPLFMEWEIEYYHIPFAHWKLERDETTGRWRYVIPVEKSLAQDANVGRDMRRIQGRTSFVPEPGNTVRARLRQIFDQSPTRDDKEKQEREDVLAKAANLEYFCSPLAGLTDHLLTLRQGPQPLPQADDRTIQATLGADHDTMVLLQESASATRELAPYGLSTPLPLTCSWNYCPFKPVTHGQARFTKMAIVDKFGQVVSGIRAGPEGDAAMYPSISPSLSCGLLPATNGADESHYWPNTVVQAEDDEKGHGLCQFFQLPPRINQKARLNAHWLTPLTDNDTEAVAASQNKSSATAPSPPSPPITRQISGEWHNPVWAWLLPNFQNHAVQVFNGSGNFVMEMLLDENNNVTQSAGPRRAGQTAHPEGRMPALLKAMQQPTFLSHLFDMLAGANDSSTMSDMQGINSLPAALGRPFCIADVGISIELSTPPLENASLIATRKPELALTDYPFPIALGNHTAGFDGLVGTFDAVGDITNVASAFDGDSERLNSASLGLCNKDYKPEEERPQPVVVKPYFLPGTTPDLATEHLRRLTATSVIMDPRASLYVYSGSLFPDQSLSLPPWPADSALRSMQACFAVGPILVPEMSSTGGYHIQSENPDLKSARPSIKMPLGSGQVADSWRWIQPYVDESAGELPRTNDSGSGGGGGGGGDVDGGAGETSWTSVMIRPLDTKLNVEGSGATALTEGYVMVR